VLERIFGTCSTQFIHNLRGNTQITRNVRQVTVSVDPKGMATWTLRELNDYLFDVYDRMDHPALGQSPREAFGDFEASGLRLQRLIPCDQNFILCTMPSTAKSTATLCPGRGVKLNHVYYWSVVFPCSAHRCHSKAGVIHLGISQPTDRRGMRKQRLGMAAQGIGGLSDGECQLAREARDAVAKWPRGFRARLNDEIWQLLGASADVQQEFRHWAQRIQRELRFPRGETDAVTSLLYRLKENGHHVWSTQDRKKHRTGSVTIESGHARATIYPLRSALIKYLIGRPAVRPKTASTSNAQSRDSGQAAAAKRNRVREARLSIIAALQRLGQQHAKRPSFIRKFKEHVGQDSNYQQRISPPPFQPPDFDRLNQSPREWMEGADRAWQLHRDRFLRGCRFWATVGVDDEIPAAKPARRPGFPALKRRHNTAMDRRFEWAAQYLCRVPLKEIAGQFSAEPSTVGRIARGDRPTSRMARTAKGQLVAAIPRKLADFRGRPAKKRR